MEFEKWSNSVYVHLDFTTVHSSPLPWQVCRGVGPDGKRGGQWVSKEAGCRMLTQSEVRSGTSVVCNIFQLAAYRNTSTIRV